MKKILVVLPNWLGDVIFSVPVFINLKKEYPGASITCLAVPRVKDILECVAPVDQIIEYDEDGRHKTPFGKLGLIGCLRKEKFDSVFLLHRSLTRALLVFLAGIPVRVGYDEKGRGGFLTHKFKSNLNEQHRIDHYLDVIEKFGVKIEERKYSLNISAEIVEEVRLLKEKMGVRDDLFTIIINPGGNWDLKRWPIKNFVKLVTRLSDIADVQVILTGAPKDKELIEEILLDSNGKVIDLSGQTDLKILIGLMAQVDLVVSGDSGPVHMASAVGMDVLALFGPTRSEITAPRGSGNVRILQRNVGCNLQACYHLDCVDNICMQAISVEDVLHEIRQIKNK